MKKNLSIAFFCWISLLAVAQQDSALHRVIDANIKKADTIAKRDGEKLAVVLTQVNPDNIRYKRFDYQEGPTFTISKADINYVFYANGARESFAGFVMPTHPGGKNDLTIQPSGWGYYYKNDYITEPDMLDIAARLHDRHLDTLIDKVEKRRTWHTITLLGGIFFLGDGLYLIATNRSVRYHSGGLVSGNSSASLEENRTIGRSLVLAGLAAEGITLYLRYNRRKYSHIVMDAYNRDVTK